MSRALEALAGAAGIERVSPVLAAAVADPKMTTEGRRDALTWLAERAADRSAASTLGEGSDLVQPLLAAAAGLADNAAEVREAAGGLLGVLGGAASADALARAVRQLPKAGATAVGERLASVVGGAVGLASMGGVMAPRPASAPAASAATAVVPMPRPGTSAGPAAPAAAPPTTETAHSAAAAASARSAAPLLAGCTSEQKEARLAKMPRKAPGPGFAQSLDGDARDGVLEELEAALVPYLREDLQIRMFSPDFKYALSQCPSRQFDSAEPSMRPQAACGGMRPAGRCTVMSGG